MPFLLLLLLPPILLHRRVLLLPVQRHRMRGCLRFLVVRRIHLVPTGKLVRIVLLEPQVPRFARNGRHQTTNGSQVDACSIFLFTLLKSPAWRVVVLALLVLASEIDSVLFSPFLMYQQILNAK
uniref:(northern house mosquito) hypothetical protein n=1 Tax=Culex pipiens TaxID=7175 RepID=A0A8D8JVN0_CULPI